MVTRIQLLQYLDEFLQPNLVQDYCPNGLQVEGCLDIEKIITGVTACQQLIDAAIKEQAQAILVHHGFFWKGEDPTIIGIKQKRLSALLQNQLNLFAYHLPLDIHSEIGNNVLLGNMLSLQVTDKLAIKGIPNLLHISRLNKPMIAQSFEQEINRILHRKPLYIASTSKHFQMIGWCTGAAQDFIEEAKLYGCDAYLTGEISERTVHIAREYDMHFFAAGHHATETYGIKALGEHLAHRFHIQHMYIDVPNPV